MAVADAEYWMARCLTLAAKGQSRTSPNPRVGAVLVDPADELLGEGWHAAYGEAHAEVAAITDAIDRHPAAKLRDATLYVNLEPCSHYGRTPPCTETILKHGIPRVIYGMSDPNPRAAGGAALLTSAGVKVTGGILGPQCWRFNEAFGRFVTTGCPLVTLKLAQSLDGCVATSTGDSQWITGERARHRVHQWRAETDAVLTGAGTALADNPSLTVRHVSGPQPRRIVVDSRGQLPPHLKVFTDSWADRTTAIISKDSAPAYASDLSAKGGRILRFDADQQGHLDLMAVLHGLGEQTDYAPVQSVLVEAGPGLATALLKAELVDRLYLFVAPSIIGKGICSFNDVGVKNLADKHKFKEHSWEVMEPDMLFRGYRHQPENWYVHRNH